jgi:hypothetical protein
VAAVVLAASCSGAALRPTAERRAEAPRVEPDPLVSIARSIAVVGPPGLQARLRRDPFSLFRFLGGPFVIETCGELERAAELPFVNLHGDAHLEQYAVAEDGRGLADFDAATTGPYVVDLVRFATSLRLAARERFPDHAAERAIERLLSGYRAALSDPGATAPEPAVVARIRERFAPSAGAWLDKVESLMSPLEDKKLDEMKLANAAFVAEMLRQYPDLQPAFFDVRNVGVIKMGVGSANEKKFLLRVAGPSAAAEDDVIYEVKEVTRIEPGSCVTGDPARDPRRVIRGQARLSGVHQRFLGFIDFDARPFYVHAWRVNYTELDATDVRTPEELAEVAYDVGLQLGRGHPQEMPDPPGTTLEAAILASLPDQSKVVVTVSEDLARRTVAAWEELVRHAARPATSAAAP